MNMIPRKKAKAEDNYRVYNDISSLPANSKPAYIGEGFAALCTGGSAVVEVFSESCRISKNDLIVILPLQLVSIRNVSEDFSITFFKVSKDMFMEIMSGICLMTPDFFFYMRKHFRYRLQKGEAERFLHFCGLIDFRVSGKKMIYRKESTMHLLRVFYWDFYVYFKEDAEGRKSFRFTHKEKIAFKFAMLIIEHHKTSREVAFYADKLCISPKYLTMIMQDVNGQSARDCIAEYVVVEMKALLRNAELDIKDLVRKTGFPNQSTLSSFFRRHTGMSPSEYRDSIHMI